MVNLHQYAISIEHRVRSLLGGGTERFALGGIVDADFIEYGGVVTAIVSGLVLYYVNDNVEVIDKFLNEIIEYNGVNFRDIGEQEVAKIDENFRDIVSKIDKSMTKF